VPKSEQSSQQAQQKGQEMTGEQQLEVVALYDYQASKPDELSFMRDDVILVTNQDFPG
jgi:hypothetical protein